MGFFWLNLLKILLYNKILHFYSLILPWMSVFYLHDDIKTILNAFLEILYELWCISILILDHFAMYIAYKCPPPPSPSSVLQETHGARRDPPPLSPPLQELPLCQMLDSTVHLSLKMSKTAEKPKLARFMRNLFNNFECKSGIPYISYELAHFF